MRWGSQCLIHRSVAESNRELTRRKSCQGAGPIFDLESLLAHPVLSWCSLVLERSKGEEGKG
jgi:hypothetical protein